MTSTLEQPASVLAPEERAELAQLKTVVRQGWQGFVTVGEALLSIRDRRLYREAHKAFGDYCEQVWGWSRQQAQQLMDAAETSHSLTTIGVQPENERQAREYTEAAKVVATLEPEMQVAVATYLKPATGSERSSTSQVKAAAEVAAATDTHGTVAHPDTGTEVPFHALTGEQRATAVAENVIQQNNSTGKGGWTDWCLNYAQQLTDTQELRIVIKKDCSGNAQVQAFVVDSESHATVAYADTAPYLKRAVMNLVEEVKG